jgi:cytochrome c biogenesis protein CcmG/thiol:disulfide interchange protein DsbE
MNPVTMSDQQTTYQHRDRRQRMRSRFITLLVLGLTAAIVMGGAYLIYRPTAAQPAVTPVAVSGPSSGASPKIGSPAPDFTATTLDGKAVSLSSYLGHPVWLSFGASSCVPCKSEAPDLEAAYKKFKDKGVIVLAIFIREDSAMVRDYSDRVGLTFSKVMDPDSRVASAYGVPDWTSDDAQGHHGFVTGFPAHFFIDRSGVLRSRQTGGLTPEQMGAALTEISR